MSYSIETIPPFDKQLKRLVKKYPSLKQELSDLAIQLEENPTLGTPLGNDCYKIRLAIASKGKGKSGGARVITHVYVQQTIIYLLTIYDKSKISDISDKEIKDLICFIQ
jgi:mRNA-degrading endonuclease RelE of RelBE toxin-antitoxin system